MLVCPRCDGQGAVLKAQVIKMNKLIFICDECDATWLAFESIGSEPWVDFGDQMERWGLPPTWDQLKILGEAA